MGKRNRSELLTSNLPQLQNLIKRDAASYRADFLTQWRHFEAACAVFQLAPAAPSAAFGEQLLFIAHVAPCYPAECAPYARAVVALLHAHHRTMCAALRKTMVQALILMRNRNMVSQTALLSLFFTLFRCNDKILRALLHTHIVNDIKNANAKAKNNKLNKTLQNFMYTMLKDTSDIAAKKSLEVMIELYKKNVWDDAKTVNVISEACFSTVPKLVAPALHFFLGSNDTQDDDDSDDEVTDLSSMRHANTVNKKTKSRKAQMEKALASIRRKERQKNRAEHFNFSALHLLNDPQGFAEHLFSRLKAVTKSNAFKFDLRLNIISLISRLIGVHKLLLLPFYDFLISYIKPHQRDVTLILAALAQSAHELIPPDSLDPLVRAIADNFIWSNCASEVITAGLNALRELCIRCPLAMPQDLLQSLIDDYKNHREKGPMNAARGLLGLFRDVNPAMLKKKDRGKGASVAKMFVSAAYGQVNVASGVDGADLLDLQNVVGLEDIPEEDEDEEAPLLVGADGEVEEEWESEDEEGEEVGDEEELEFEIDSDEIGSIDSDVESDKEEETESQSPAKKQKTNIATEKV